MRWLSASFVLVVVLVWPAHHAAAAEVRMSPWKDRDYYAWIVFLSEGPTMWREIPSPNRSEGPKSVGRAYRVVQLVSEIYDTILVEEVTFGHEGCCKKVRSVTKIDLDAFAKAFGFVGEISGFEFIQWGSGTSFLFRFKGRLFLATGLGKPALTVSESETLAPNPALQPTPQGGAAERRR